MKLTFGGLLYTRKKYTSFKKSSSINLLECLALSDISHYPVLKLGCVTDYLNHIVIYIYIYKYIYI